MWRVARFVGAMGLIVVLTNVALLAFAAYHPHWDLQGLVFVLSPWCNLTLAVALVASGALVRRKLGRGSVRWWLAVGLLFPLLAAVAYVAMWIAVTALARG